MLKIPDKNVWIFNLGNQEGNNFTFSHRNDDVFASICRKKCLQTKNSAKKTQNKVRIRNYFFFALFFRTIFFCWNGKLNSFSHYFGVKTLPSLFVCIKNPHTWVSIRSGYCENEILAAKFWCENVSHWGENVIILVRKRYYFWCKNEILAAKFLCENVSNWGEIVIIWCENDIEFGARLFIYWAQTSI